MEGEISSKLCENIQIPVECDAKSVAHYYFNGCDIEIIIHNYMMNCIVSGHPGNMEIIITQDKKCVYNSRHKEILSHEIEQIEISNKAAVQHMFINNCEIFAFQPHPSLDITVSCIEHRNSLNEHTNKLMNCLSDREREILMCSLDGKKNAAVALETGICESTVKATMSHIYRKLNVCSKSELFSLIYKY